jgi:tyrosine-protein kinase Etk/Wzc
MDRNVPNKDLTINILDLLMLIVRKKAVFFIVGFIFVAGGVVVSLLYPKSFIATTVLMPPENNSLGLAGIMPKLSFGKLDKSMFSSGSDQENIYLAILKSKTLQLDVVNHFDLVRVYKFDKSKKYYIEDVLKIFSNAQGIVVSNESTISISIEDKSPSRAAEMANYMAQKLDEIYKRLTLETARNRRIFLEERLAIIKRDLADAEQNLSSFQKDAKMVNIDEQTKATIDAGATVEARYFASKLELDIAKKTFAGVDPKIKEMELELNEIGKQRKRLTSDRISDMFIPLALAPELGLKFLRFKREVKIQELLFEFVMQQYEQAKFEEAKNTPNVQILDPATPPQKKSKPKRMVMVIMAFFISIFCSFLFILVQEYFLQIKSANSEVYRKVMFIVNNLLRLKMRA